MSCSNLIQTNAIPELNNNWTEILFSFPIFILSHWKQFVIVKGGVFFTEKAAFCQRQRQINPYTHLRSEVDVHVRYYTQSV